MPIPIDLVPREELKQRVEQALEEHTVFTEFFGEMIRMRVEQTGWLDNALIQLLVMDAKENIVQIEEILERCNSGASEALDHVRIEVRGSEREFDQSIYDVLAEVHALDWLLQNEYTNIEKIKSSSKGKTPDFKAKRENWAIVEVKNFRAPSELSSLAMLALERQQLIYPSLYSAKRFMLVIDDLALGRISVSATDRLAIEQFCSELDHALVEARSDLTFQYRTTATKASAIVRIDCS